MPYRTFFPANAAGGLLWGTAFCLLGYFVGEKVESASGIASYVFFGLLILAAVVLTVRRRRREKRQLEGPADPG
jgi:membrane protein DedA with SNARE-associated domain